MGEKKRCASGRITGENKKPFSDIYVCVDHSHGVWFGVLSNSTFMFSFARMYAPLAAVTVPLHNMLVISITSWFIFFKCFPNGSTVELENHV